MPRFVTHEPLAQGLFNDKQHTAQGTLQPWLKHLTNNEQLLMLLVGRMDQDWVSLAPKMRKPWNGKDVDTQLRINMAKVFIPSNSNQTCLWVSNSSNGIQIIKSLWVSQIKSDNHVHRCRGGLAASLWSLPGGS